jgi:hypothetical protein
MTTVTIITAIITVIGDKLTVFTTNINS